MSDQLGERTTNWICARKPRETESGESFDDPTVKETAKNIYAMAAKQSQGSFKPQREGDILTAGLGNPEHPVFHYDGLGAGGGAGGCALSFGRRKGTSCKKQFSVEAGFTGPS